MNSSVVRPPRIALSCSSVNGTRTPPPSRGISMKSGVEDGEIVLVQVHSAVRDSSREENGHDVGI